MSVTFFPATDLDTTGEWALSCYCCNTAPTIYPSYEAAHLARRGMENEGIPVPGCTSTDPTSVLAGKVDAVRVLDDGVSHRLSNSNAAVVLDALGLTPEAAGDQPSGSLPASDFLARVENALARLTPWGASLYVFGRLWDLRDLATWADSHQTTVVWC